MPAFLAAAVVAAALGPSPVAAVHAGGPTHQRLDGGAVAVTCAAGVDGSCRASAHVRIGGRTYGARAHARLLRGRATTLSVRFGPAGRRAIRTAVRRGPVLARVRLRVAATGRRRATVAHVVTLVG